MKDRDVKKTTKGVKHSVLISILTGAVAGLVNGVFGGGGGMVVVPMLTKLLKFESKNSHATAILIILPLSIISGILYLSFGKFSLEIGTFVVIGIVVGGVLGAILLSKLSSKWIMIIFSIVMAIAGGKMLLF